MILTIVIGIVALLAGVVIEKHFYVKANLVKFLKRIFARHCYVNKLPEYLNSKKYYTQETKCNNCGTISMLYLRKKHYAKDIALTSRCPVCVCHFKGVL